MARKRRDLLAHRDVLTFAAAGLWVLQCLLFRRYHLDDAYIAYRYAHHLAEGLGPVMNAGERVEGVSNLPWTALLGLLSAIGLEPHAVAPALSLLCGFACIALVSELTGRILEDRRAGGFAALLFAASAPVAVWSVSGMETLAFTLLLTLAMLQAVRDLTGRGGGVRAGLWVGAAACMRPEGLAYAVPLLLAGRRRGRWLGRLLVGILSLVVPLLLFRLLYYGDWLPNPVRAKAVWGTATFVSGGIYLVGVLLAYPVLFASLVVLPRLPVVPRWLLGGWAATCLGVAFVAGGERIPAFRLLLPAWPVLAFCGEAGLRQLRLTALRRTGVSVVAILLLLAGIWLLLWPGSAQSLGEAVLKQARFIGEAGARAPRLLAELRFAGGMAVAVALGALLLLRLHPALHDVEGVEKDRHSTQGFDLGRLVHESRRARRAMAIVATIFLGLTLLPGGLAPALRACLRPDPAVRYGLPVGRWLRRNVEPGTLVATNCAGSLAYESELPVLDMLGLTDSHIARSHGDAAQWAGHAKGDAAYVLSRQPGIIIFGGPEGSEEPWPFPGERAIAASEDFKRDYRLQRVALQGFDFTYYVRRDLQPGEGVPTRP